MTDERRQEIEQMMTTPSAGTAENVVALKEAGRELLAKLEQAEKANANLFAEVKGVEGQNDELLAELEEVKLQRDELNGDRGAYK